MKRVIIIVLLTFLGALSVYFQKDAIFGIVSTSLKKVEQTNTNIQESVKENVENNLNNLNPLSIEYMRKQKYVPSDFIFEQKLGNGVNYKKYIVSYKSENNKIYALLTIPTIEMPEGGFPVVIFNHGYIPPKEYRTDEKYVAYQDAFAKAGYVTLKSDYRGHGQSEGNPSGGYGSPNYTADVLNAVASIKKLRNPDNQQIAVNSEKIGMWGHSMGGYITLRSMVANQNIKVAVIWAGVVASYPDLINNWRRPGITPDIPKNVMPTLSSWRGKLIQQFGEPSEESAFWRSISANFYLNEVTGPIQIHHGTSDSTVPVEFSRKLEKQLKEAGKEVEYFEYVGDDHNLSNNLFLALDRSVKYFDKYLK